MTWADTKRGRGPDGTAVRSGESASVQDFTTDPLAAPWRESALERGYRSCIALPLKGENGGTFGVLGIYSAEPGAFTPDEIRLLEELSGDLAFGIVTLRNRVERKRADDELKERERHSQSLLRLSRRLEQAATYPEVLDAARDEVRDVLGYQSVWAYLLTDDRKYLKSIVASGPTADYVMSEDGTATLTIEGDPMLEEIAAAREIVVVEDARTDVRTNKEIVAAMGLRTIVNVPVMLFDRHLGSVGTGSFGDEGVRVPTTSEQRYLIALASHMAVTLDRIHLLNDRRQAEAEKTRLATAIDQSPDSVVITDTAGAIEYVNPAFERATGYERAEVLGQNPRILKSGQQPPAFYLAMWAALTAGQPWLAEFVNRRKDGSLFTEEGVISPVRDEQARTTGYVAVKRDVTRQRAAEAHATQMARERSIIADTIGRLGAPGTPEEAAHAICQQVVSMAGLHVAGIFIFMLDGRAMPLAIVTADGQPAPLRRLPYQRSQYLRERADSGPWVETWVNRPWHPYNRSAIESGVTENAFAPLRHGGALQGFLLASKRPTPGMPLSDDLSALVEFAGLASATLGPAIAERTEVSRVRTRLSSVVSEHAFHPVFQPIVDTRHQRVVAYEALTRFDDGTAPDVVFAEAAEVGLGIELEAATLEAALVAARGLPHWVWLQLNASPALILRGEPLRTIVARAGRRLVLEVTEHTAIDDYVAFRAALAALGPRVSLAVDDAGAGFASLRHVLELSPAFVKLDRSLVEGIDTDPARQAMVAGMRHFAMETHSRLIAEGVETEAELRALTADGVRLAQGYLLGRPAPLKG
ncbi:MAG: EAL domain-containing protein [Acidimicrobiales bacterium]